MDLDLPCKCKILPFGVISILPTNCKINLSRKNRDSLFWTKLGSDFIYMTNEMCRADPISTAWALDAS